MGNGKLGNRRLHPAPRFEGDRSDFDSAAPEGEDGSPAEGVERRSIRSSNAARKSRTLRNFVDSDLFADTPQCVTVSMDHRVLRGE